MGRLFKKWTRPALVAGWILLASGCATTTTPTPAPSVPAQPTPQPPADVDKRFVIAPELERILHIVSVRLTRSQEGYLKIQVNVQNITTARQNFSYRIEWFDGDGAPLPVDTGGYESWMLRPSEESSIVATAPAQAAVDFEIAFVPTAK